MVKGKSGASVLNGTRGGKRGGSDSLRSLRIAIVSTSHPRLPKAAEDGEGRVVPILAGNHREMVGGARWVAVRVDLDLDGNGTRLALGGLVLVRLATNDSLDLNQTQVETH